MPTRNYDPDHVTIKHVFESQYLAVPKFQRPYTWKKENIENLWEDLTSVKDENYSHFLGVIVLVDQGYTDEKDGRNRKVIIDGQQRFITYTIFYSVIRNLFWELEEEEWAGYTQKVIEKEDSSGPIATTLIPGNELKEFFKENIQVKHSSHDFLMNEAVLRNYNEEEQNVIRNYRYFVEFITNHEKWLHKSRKDFLHELKELVEATELIQVLVESEDYAYDLFETLNARSVTLSEVDLIKNRIFMELSDQIGPENLEQKWNEIATNVAGPEKKPEKIQRFLKHYWWSRYDKSRPKKIFRDLKNRDMYNELEEFRKDSFLYFEITTSDSTYRLTPKGVDLQDLKLLSQLLNLRQVYIPMLSILRKLKRDDYQKEYSTSNLHKLVGDLMRFVFLYAHSQKSPSIIENMYSDFSIDIYNAQNRTEFDKSIQEFRNKLRDNQPKKDEFLEEINKTRYKPDNSQNNRIIKFALEKINYQDKNEQRFDEVNLDHILPQTSREDQEDTTEQDILHKIGNLAPVYTKDNSGIGNEAPENKVDLYRSSNIELTKNIPDNYDLSSWTTETIEQRTKELNNAIWEYFKLQ